MILKNEVEAVLGKSLQKIIEKWVEKNRNFIMTTEARTWSECLAFDIMKGITPQLLKAIENDRGRKFVDIEDCMILGYSWPEIKEAVNYAKSRGFISLKEKGEMRYSTNEIDTNNVVRNGFDYDLQVWIKNYIIQDCGHRGGNTADFPCCNARKYHNKDIRDIL